MLIGTYKFKDKDGFSQEMSVWSNAMKCFWNQRNSNCENCVCFTSYICICWNFGTQMWEINNLGFQLLYSGFYCLVYDSLANTATWCFPLSFSGIRGGVDSNPPPALLLLAVDFLESIPFAKHGWVSVLIGSCTASLPFIQIWIRSPQGVTYSYILFLQRLPFS